MFRIVPAVITAYYISIVLTAFNILCAGVILFFGNQDEIALAGFAFCILASTLNVAKPFRNHPFSQLLNFAISFYFVLPITFMAAMGQDFQFGVGLSHIPQTNQTYREIAPEAILYLAFCLFAMFSGFALGYRKSSNAGFWYFSKKNTMIWAIGLTAIYCTYAGIQYGIQVRLTGQTQEESLLRFIFFDLPYLTFLGLSLFTLLTRNQGKLDFGTKFMAFAIFGGLLVVSMTGGSKGYILVILILAFVLPVCYLKENSNNLVLLPTKKLMVVLIPVCIAVFIIGFNSRAILFQGQPLFTSISKIFNDFSAGGPFILNQAQHLLYRISAALDRFILLYQSFISMEHSSAYANEFMIYLGKNFLNLILPGTPFPETYAPSSQMFTNVIFKSPLEGSMTEASFARKMNTQPYTFPGVLLVIGGKWAPPLIFLISFGLSGLYSFVKIPFVRVGLLSLMIALFHSYGLEPSVADSIHFTVSLAFFLFLCTLANSLHLRPARKGVPSPAPNSLGAEPL